MADIHDELDAKASELAKKLEQSFDEVFAALLKIVEGKT